MTDIISSLAIPAVIAVLCFCFIRKQNAFESFVKGAREGLSTVVSVLPAMTLLLVALSMFSESGAADGLSAAVSPIADRIGIPAGIIPLVITRPFSGSAATAAYTDVLSRFGADSREAFCASVIMGSGDTLVYVISVYYSVTRVKKTKYVFPVSLFCAVFCVFFACILTSLFYK